MQWFSLIPAGQTFVEKAAHVSVLSAETAFLYTDYDADLGPEREGPMPVKDAILKARDLVTVDWVVDEVVVSFANGNPEIWADAVAPITDWKLLRTDIPHGIAVPK